MSMLRDGVDKLGLTSDHVARRTLRQARLVDESTRYFVAGLAGVPGVHRYSLAGRELFLRHPGDSWTFEELLRACVYDLPAEIRAQLPADATVVDLGANIGLFGVAILEQVQEATVIGFEPDPANLHVLVMNLAPELAHGSYVINRAAAGVSCGTAAFLAGRGGRSRVLSERTPGSIEVQVHDVMPIVSSADLVKIDIEGGEWDILADARLQDGPTAIALEYHSSGCPSPPADRHATHLLIEAGFEIVAPSRPFTPDEFPEHQGMLWAIRPREDRPGVAAGARRASSWITCSGAAQRAADLCCHPSL